MDLARSCSLGRMLSNSMNSAIGNEGGRERAHGSREGGESEGKLGDGMSINEAPQ